MFGKKIGLLLLALLFFVVCCKKSAKIQTDQEIDFSPEISSIITQTYQKQTPQISKKFYTFGKVKLLPVKYIELPNWHGDYNFLLAKKAFMQLCKFANSSKNKGKNIEFKNASIRLATAEEYLFLCSQLVKKRSNEDIKYFFEKNFTPFKIYSRDSGLDSGTFTGYYRIELDGSLKKTRQYKYPVYKRPPELKNGEKYHTREQIAGGALKGRKLELVWLKDIVDAYLLHIQGTGIARLTNGEKMFLSFDVKNGQEYSSAAQYAKDKGIMKNLGGLTFYDWIRQNPREGQKFLNANKSFVFFKKSEDSTVLGSSGIGLVPGASMAVDSSFVPYSAALWLATEPTPYSAQGVNAFFIAADTGADIKGVIRGDIYFGNGEEASYNAHHTKVSGGYYILLPNGSIAIKQMLKYQ